MVAHCASYATPISWEQIVPLEKEGTSIRQFMGEARSCGLNSGVSIPVHTPQGGFSILNLSSSKPYVRARPDILHAMPHAQLFAAYLHENVRKVLEQELGAWSRVHLTTRERECLLWAAEGKTAWETSHILHISERTVVFHLQNAMKKLDTVNRQQAVARAVLLGLITPKLG